MSYSSAILVILVSASVAALLAALVRRYVRVEVLRRYHDVGSSAFLQIGVLYAVLLAFVFGEVWQQYNTAQQAIATECSSLHGIAILTQTLAEPGRDDVARAMTNYVHAVIEQEWPAMAQGQESGAAMSAFRSLWQTAVRV